MRPAVSHDTIIDCVERGWRDNWTSPTVRELAACAGVSVDHAHTMLQRMVESGLLEVKRLSERRVLYRVKT